MLTFRDISERHRSAKLLDYQSALNKAITQNATTAIFMIDAANRCIFMNPAAETMIGYAFEEAKGQMIHGLMHHSRADASPFPIEECPLHRALPDKQVVHSHEDLLFRRSGEAFPVRCNARPIFEGDEAVGTVIEVFDLTEQRQADEALRESDLRFTQLADAIPQLAWMARPDGHINWFNTRWIEYTGKDPLETAGWDWQSVHDPTMLPQVLQKWRHSLTTGTPFDMVFPLRGRDGKFRPFLTRVMPFRDEKGRIVRWFGTNTDISDQQQIQAELRELASRLSEADRRKYEFLATLAHELRNPLAPIRTGLEVMKHANHARAEVQRTLRRRSSSSAFSRIAAQRPTWRTASPSHAGCASEC